MWDINADRYSGTNAAIYECFETIWAILVDDKHSVEWHITEFEKMAENLCGYTKSCVISFIDIYKFKVESNFQGAREVSKKDRIILGKEFIKILSLMLYRKRIAYSAVTSSRCNIRFSTCFRCSLRESFANSFCEDFR